MRDCPVLRGTRSLVVSGWEFHVFGHSDHSKDHYDEESE
jgi:hypothetical protein